MEGKIKKIDYANYKKPSEFATFNQGENVIHIVTEGFIGKIHVMKTARTFLNLGPCLLPEYCQHCDKNNKPKNVWRWIVIDRAIGEPRVLDAGPMIGDQICKIAAKEGNPVHYDLIVTRNGEGLKTQYDVVKSRENDITEEEKQKYGPMIQYLKKKYMEG